LFVYVGAELIVGDTIIVYGISLGFTGEGIRSNKWKYFRYRFINTPKELYNLENDPLEIHNLALDSKYDMILNIFRKELDYKTQSGEASI
tara:strand:+ start:205 stop:474 length:270 start_codon:yes stop_codon:yes gene_type:complete